MMTPDELNPILERITQHQQTEQDLEMLRRSLRLADSVVQSVSQDGKFNTNVGEITGGEVHIGDRIFQGTDAEVIKEALRSVLQEKQKVERPRNEKLLLQAVKDEVVARLKQSLHNTVLINLGKETQPEEVKRPWSSDIKIGDSKLEPIPDDRSILEVFDQEEIAGKLLILGNPGAGKTTTMLDLAKALIARAEQDADYPIPVLFNLSAWKDDRQSISNWLVVELKSKYGVRKDIGAKWVSDAKLLPMLDGLDELESVRQEPCVRKINEYLQSDRRPEYLVVCSRLEEYDNYATELQLNGAIFLQELDDRQIQGYLKVAGQAESWQILEQDKTLLELLRKPLLLSIAVLSTQEIYLEKWKLLPSKQMQIEYLLDAYVRRMLSREIRTVAYVRKKIPSHRLTRKWLVYLAQQLERESQTEFLIEKMQPSWLLSSSQEKVYKITFVFVYTLFFGLGFGLIVSLYISWIVGFVVGFAAAINAEIKPIERLNRSWKRIDRGLIISLIYGRMIGVIAAFSALLILKLSIVTIDNIIYTLICGLIGELVSGLIYMMIDSDIKIPSIPNQGIVQSAKNSILSGIIGTVFILILGIVFIGWGVLSLESNEKIAIFFKILFINYLGMPLLGILIITALGVGIIAALMGGGKACIQHFVLRLILYRNGYIPWNYARFLDYCTECLFLQRVGGRYRFIHRLLQEHFAAMPLEK